MRARLALLAGTVLAVAAVLSGGTVAQADTAAPAATAAVSGGQCSFDPVVLCQSTDSTIALNAVYTNTSACTFVWHVVWGDGSVSDVTDTDPADGSVLLADHAYKKPGTYAISDTGQATATAGTCSATPGSYHFSLIEPMVALGDSYSSGEGDGNFVAGTNTAADQCHRSYDAYPELLYASQKLGDLNFVSCSGAITDDYFNANNEGNHESAQSKALSSDTKIVTLTFGGNDVGFSSVLNQCAYGKVTKVIVHGSDCSKDTALKAVVAKRLQALAGNGSATTPAGKKIHSIASILQSIHTLAPNAKIYVAGYPLLFGSNIRTECGVGTIIADGIHVALKLNKTEVAWLNSVGTSLNQVLKSAAAANHATFVDVSPKFNSHRFCDTSSSWFNPVTGTYGLKSKVLNVAVGSFHPTPTGQKSGYEAAFEAAGL
jgi:lysophospholipase L1-like esterase